MDEVTGLEPNPAPILEIDGVSTARQYGGGKPDDPGRIDKEQLIDGLIYDISPWGKNIKKGRWNASTGKFEEV